MRLFNTCVPLVGSINGIADSSDDYVAYIPLCNPAIDVLIKDKLGTEPKHVELIINDEPYYIGLSMRSDNYNVLLQDNNANSPTFSLAGAERLFLREFATEQMKAIEMA